MWGSPRAGSFLLGHESGHSIARPTACGSRVPPQRTVLGETPGPPPGQVQTYFRSLLSLLVAHAVPTVWNTWTISTSSTTQTIMMLV